MLILGFDLNMIISGKTIHEGEYLTSHTLIQNLINKWCGKIILLDKDDLNHGNQCIYGSLRASYPPKQDLKPTPSRERDR